MPRESRVVRSKLAELVRARRKELGLSQERVAELMGMAPNYISMLEINRVDRPGNETLRALADVLDMSVEPLLVATGQLDPVPTDDPAALLLHLDSLPTAEARLEAFRNLPPQMRRAIRRLMRDLFAEAAEQLEE